MASNEMQYRPLGRCGTRVSYLSLGGWTTFGGSVTDKSDIRTILQAAYEAGINFFDIADAYEHGEAERVMGDVLRDYPRHQLVISSKVFFPMSDDVNDRGLSRKHIMESVENSLRNVGTDYLDIYFCHRFDRRTPVEETARAMDDLVHQGKVLYWGTSEWSGSQLRHAHSLCDARNLYRPQVEQPEYNLLTRKRFEQDVRPAVQELGMGTVIWSPLASGLLTGKYRSGIPSDTRLAQIDWLREAVYTEERVARAAALDPIAQELGATPSQVALAWAVSQPGVSSVILGVTRLEQLRENLAAPSFDLTDDMLEQLDEAFPTADA